MMKEIIRKVQVCIPFDLLKEKYLHTVLKNRINPEIGISGDALDTHPKKAFIELACLLRREGLTITLHAPFFDLVPGGMDKKMLRATRERLREAFDLIPVFEPISIVCHTGYDRKRYPDPEGVWLSTAIETWEPLIRNLGGTKTVLVFENVYEKTPRMLLKLLNGLKSEKTGFCFDTGHMNVFSETDMMGWLEAMAPFLRQLHLHDNEGITDDHLAIGAGKISFDPLFDYLETRGIKPIVTLEAHQEKGIRQSLEVLSRSERFRRLLNYP